MKFTALPLIFSLFIVSIYAAATTGGLPTPKPQDGLPPASIPTEASTSTVAPVDSTTTAPVTTEATKTTSTSTQAPTTTVTPKTTTPEPTTQKSTTPVPTTPAPAPTTTAKPEPIPPPTEGQFVVTSGNESCILLQLKAQVNASYTDETNIKYKVFNLPGTDGKFKQVNGDCGNASQSVIIDWADGFNGTNYLKLTFNLNETTKEFSLKEGVFNLTTQTVPGSQNRTILYYVGTTFEAPKGKAYHCNRPQTWNLTDNEVITNNTVTWGTVSVTDVLAEPFHKSDKLVFSTAIDCDAINTPDIVPIAVGIALIALVVVVLIAYLVGRRRAAARGYVSM